MIKCKINKDEGIIHVIPLGPWSDDDFENLAAKVDRYIEKNARLTGLILEITKFPGWENFDAAISHFRFVKDHHKNIKKVAVVTDSFFGSLADNIATHFVSAEMRHFEAGEIAKAKEWIVKVSYDELITCMESLIGELENFTIDYHQ